MNPKHRTSGESNEFDAYADAYDEALMRGVSVSGEDKDYFASGRVQWTLHRLDQMKFKPQNVLDFGCGTGSAVPHFLADHRVQSLHAIDLSAASIAVAARNYSDLRLKLQTVPEFAPCGAIDLAFCNGVFHHIPLTDRLPAADIVYRALKPGGLFALWENNPWNPGTRIVMSRIPFDRDAIPVSAPKARNLLHKAGFEIMRTDFMFIFPRILKWMRALEPALASLPLGAQYMVIGRKPIESGSD
jgi:SAM-dependent methyltransferase